MNLVLRGGTVLTMDPELGEFDRADVHLADGRIVAVGPGLSVPEASIVDVTGSVVLPGFVETHWHLWNTLLRGAPGGYFAACAGLGRSLTPDDIHRGTSLSCAQALRCGMTFVHDWCHNVRSPAHARAALGALAESGLRGRFSYGYGVGHRNDEPMDLVDLARLAGDWTHDRISLGMAWRGQGGSDPAVRVPPEVYRREAATARGLGLPISVHASGPRSARGQIAGLADLLGPDTQIVHADNASDAELRLLAETGAVVSLSPVSEMRIGYGFPRTRELLDAGIPVGLSTDTTMLTGKADPFATMKTLLGVANAAAGDEAALTPRRVLELATVEGARTMGLGRVTGSLRPGKHADVTVIALGDWPGDPAEFLVTAAQPADVRLTLVGGVTRYRHPGRPAGSAAVQGRDHGAQ
ncbi:MAG TPA: amidohydrolase family protein [Amycolatopsis sp.]|nr:amidohydrolase family protein [Amycolatopsis sp.]